MQKSDQKSPTSATEGLQESALKELTTGLREMDEIFFRMGTTPRKWRDWHCLPIRSRRAKFQHILNLVIRSARQDKKRVRCWTLIKLAKHLKLLKGEPLETQELYLRFLDIHLHYPEKNYFAKVISNPVANDRLLGQIGMHNFLLKDKFKQAGLSWERWHRKRSRAFSVNIPNHPSQWERLKSELDRLSGMLNQEHPLRASLQKDCMALKQKKKEIMESRIELPGTTSGFFPKFSQGSLHLMAKRPKEYASLLTDEQLGKKMEEVVSLTRELNEPRQRNFKVRLWNRGLWGNVVAGNCVGNCLSIGDKNVFPATLLNAPGKKRPAGILDYLVDMGVQVAEIVEKKDKNEYVAVQTYFFVFLDHGQPVLMVDSIEVHPLYGIDRRKSLNLKLRNKLFDFLKRYARSVGITRVVLGKNGPVLKSGPDKGERHQIQNDIDVGGLPVVKIDKIEKLGGYWNHQPYFLESLGGTEAYVIV
ncbi:MAG: hypothetical protein Q8P76_03045 [bacterium]|nr:hypothetical protein [bacterium]